MIGIFYFVSIDSIALRNVVFWSNLLWQHTNTHTTPILPVLLLSLLGGVKLVVVGHFENWGKIPVRFCRYTRTGIRVPVTGTPNESYGTRDLGTETTAIAYRTEESKNKIKSL